MPIRLVQNIEDGPKGPSIKDKKPHTSKKPPFSLEINGFNPLSAEITQVDPDKLAQDALVDEKWRRFWVDQEWIRTAVTYSLSQTTPDNARLVVPQWDHRLQTLRSRIQSTSRHNIFIKLALLRETRKTEKSMLHLQPKVKSVIGAEERVQEVILGFVEDILEKATAYANDLYTYFEKCSATAVPEEPPVPAELQKARERMRVEEAAATGKPGQKGTKKFRTPDVSPDEQSSPPKSRNARESGDKSALAVNRPSKSGASSAKSSVAGKDLKRTGASANTNAEIGKTEKDFKQQIAALEAEYDAAMEVYESKMTEFRRWRQQKEAEIEPKVRSFTMALWEQGMLGLLNGIVQPIECTAQLEHNAAIEDFKRDVNAKRDVTLRKLYERLIEIGGNLAMAAEGWRMQLNDSLMHDDTTREYGDVNKKWEQRRKELKIWKMERPNECYTMQPGNIWQSPYSYEKHTSLLEPVPYRHQMETSVTGNATVKDTEITVTKFGDSIKKFSPRNVFNNVPEHPSGVLASTISGKNIAANVEQPSGAAEVIRAIRTGLISAVTDSTAEIQHNSDTDDWTDEEVPDVDGALFEQSHAQTETKLPSDFKFVSFKKSTAVGSVDPKLIAKKQTRTNQGTHIPDKDEHSSSDED